MDHFPRRPQLTPRRIAAIYLLFGMGALGLSDLLLPRVVSGRTLRRLQLVKGAVEVALTAGLVYALVWYGQQSLQAANDRLERNEEVLQVLLRLLRHDIRNDMNVIQGHAETARSESDDDDVEASCHAILSTTDDLLRQTETVNELRGMLEGATDQRRFDLASLVDDVVREARRTTGAELAVSTEDVEDVTVSANSLLPVALGEVVDNAVRHHGGGEVAVEFRTDADERSVELYVADDGPGIPPAELEVLADREESPLVHSSGMGLWFVYWVVADSGGTVAIRVPDEGGTVVSLSLPRADVDAPVADTSLPGADVVAGAE